MLFGFSKRGQPGIVIDGDYEHALPPVFCPIRVLDDVENVAPFTLRNDFLEWYAHVPFELHIRFNVPCEVLRGREILCLS